MEEGEVLLGGQTVDAKEDYLKSINNIFYRINAAADTKSLSDLAWILSYHTDVLISAILDRNDRERMADAKESVFQAEILKIEVRSKGSMTDEEKKQARVNSCTKIIGECRAYFDKYFGFETKLSALV